MSLGRLWGVLGESLGVSEKSLAVFLGCLWTV